MAVSRYQWSMQGTSLNSNNDNWSVVLTDTRYSTFEDPFSGTPVPKREYDALYGPACREVFQCGITIGVLFAPNPVIMGEWRFADEDARADLYDAAVELKLVPSFDEVCAGETHCERTRRTAGPCLSRGCPTRGVQEEEVVGVESSVGVAKAPKTKKTVAELQAELTAVLAEFERSGLSNKRLKKLERRRRGIMSALEKSDEGIASETHEGTRGE